MKFEFLQHTADAKFRAYGATMEEAFANAAEAMFTVMLDCAKVEPNVAKKISVTGADRKAMLYNFLEELLFLLDTHGFFLHKVDKVSIKDDKLTATIQGDTDPEKYETHGDVKAVTYNEMEILEEKGKVTVQVVVDI